MNWIIIIIVSVLALGLIVFTIIHNLKDKKNYEEEMNNDYQKANDEKGNFDDDEL